MLTSGLKGSVEHVLTNTTGNFHLNLVTGLQQECQGWLEVLASLSSGRIAVQMKLPISCKLSKGEQRLLCCQLGVSIHQVSHVLKQQNWMGYSGTNYVTTSRAHRSFIWTNVIHLQSSNVPGPREMRQNRGWNPRWKMRLHQFTVSNTTVILNSRIRRLCQ